MPRRWPSNICSFESCKNNSNSDGIHLFRFPKEKNRCQAWVEACKNPKLGEIPPEKLYSSVRVCSNHFHDWCFMNKISKNRLVHNAIPCKPEPYHTVGEQDKFLLTSIENSIASPSVSAFSPVKGVANCSTPKRKYTPTKAKLAKKIKQQNDATRKLKSRFASYRQKIKNAEKMSLKKKLEKQGVNENLSHFIDRQVKLSTQKIKGRRYTQFDKVNAYQIFCKSRSAYRMMQGFLQLPSPQTLQRFISARMSTPGINTDVLTALKDLLQNKSESERLFAIVFDEMSIKPFLVYDKKNDNIVGFENFGSGSGAVHSGSGAVATQALVLMLRSLTSRRKMPLGFFFSRHGMRAEKLKEIILGALQTLYSIGVIVKALICDQGSNNTRLFTILGIESNRTYFMFEGNKIYGIYDPPHLLKNLRRNLMKYDLKTDKGLCSFKYIKDFYELDKKMLARAAPKLTDKHIYANGLNSMKVSLASQIFSNTVSAGMNLCLLGGLINASSGPTVEFVRTINDLFDSTNGTRRKPFRGKSFHCAVAEDSPHLRFWKDMITFLQSWKFVNTAPGKKKQAIPRCKTGWLLTLTSLSELSQELLSQLQYFMPGRCNQDCLENFFSRVRGSGGNRVNPTAYEFQSAYKLACVNVCTSASKFSNCQPDDDKFMLYLLSSGTQTDNEMKDVSSSSDCPKDPITDSDDEAMNATSVDDFSFMEKNVCAYLSGYLARRVLTNNCSTCEDLLLDKSKKMLQHSMYLYFKEYDNRGVFGLKYPSENMLKYIAACMKISETTLSSCLSSPNISQNLQNLLCEIPLSNFINCAEHAVSVKSKLVSHAAKLFIKMHLREYNRKIASTSTDLKSLRIIKKKKC